MAELLDYLQRAVTDGASDLFLIAGGCVSEKVEGRICAISEEKVLPPETERLITGIYEMAGRDMGRYQTTGDDDFSFAVPGLAGFRVNAYRPKEVPSRRWCRVVSFSIPDWKSLHIPENVMNLADTPHGMVLITGTAGSGKSTTQACIIDRINHTREGHIITLEDPIEYLHRDQKSIISQREIAVDTEDYLSALRACLRQAPDVILLGEMRDHETIRTAMTAAETGHLAHCNPSHPGRGEHGGPDHRCVSPGTAGTDPGALSMSADGGIPAAPAGYGGEAWFRLMSYAVYRGAEYDSGQ